MKTAVGVGEPDDYDWVDDPHLTVSLTWSRFEQLRSVPVTTCGGPAATLTIVVE